MARVLALNVNGDITYCTCPPELRGSGRCNHVAHQNEGESPEEFVERINSSSFDDGSINPVEQANEVTQEQIDRFAEEIDKIAGCHVTGDNLNEVLKSLTPDQVAKITQIGFNAAPVFSLPIRDEQYEDENVKNKLYFANLYKHGAGGSASAIAQMFERVGPTPTHHGEMVDIQHSYEQGLTPDEYFAKQYYARQAMITKGVGTSKPGYCISGNSQVTVLFDGNLESVLWSDVDVGTVMECGSVVEEVRQWQQKQCVTVSINDQRPITMSYDHLVMGEIILHGKRVENLAASKSAREAIGEADSSWICAEDMLFMFGMGAKILLSTGNEIEKIKDAGIQEVRCVSTNTGFYETNGMVHHNTARKLFYATSDTQVMEDCGGPYVDAMHCKLPNGHVCVHCAHMTKGGESVHVGQLVGGVVSTNLSEGLTQASMELKHPIWENQELAIVRNGLHMKIYWKNLEVGDEFPDGAKVLDITPWDHRDGYLLDADGSTLVCSDTHLVLAIIFDKKDQRLNGSYQRSEQIRKDVGADDSQLWMCAQDIFDAFHAGHNVDIISPNNDVIQLENIERYGDAPIKVRCITTDVGYYGIGEFMNHNTGTMASMDKQNSAAVIMATLDRWGTSPLIQSMRNAKTTEEMRQILYQGLKDEYKKANIKQDEFNLQMIAKKMTSYKRTESGLRPVEDGERADVVSIGAVGNANNIFKTVELSAGYNTLTKPSKQSLGTDAANQIIN